jgi:type II secretory pathway component GspD/PulD (secretin)
MGRPWCLGGIYEINNSNTVTKVPGLGDIPGIGALFRTTSRSNTKAELLIFVTPRILSRPCSKASMRLIKRRLRPPLFLLEPLLLSVD